MSRGPKPTAAAGTRWVADLSSNQSVMPPASAAAATKKAAVDTSPAERAPFQRSTPDAL